MSDDMVRCSACGTPHGSIEDATVCCEKDKPGVVGRKCPVCGSDKFYVRDGVRECLICPHWEIERPGADE